MKTMIFAAGKGTRLKPLTDNTPKALIKVNGVTMLEHVIQKLKVFGVDEIIINVHYLANQIIDFLDHKNNFEIRIEISNESDQLLDTGGGLKKAEWFFNDQKPFILHNVDILSNINLDLMLKQHQKNNALVSLAVRDRKSSRYFLFNKNGELSGWENIKTRKKIISKPSPLLTTFAFSGIHIINPSIFKFINLTGPFSIVDTYLELCKNNMISAYNHSNDYWFDIGKPDDLKKAERFLNANHF